MNNIANCEARASEIKEYFARVDSTYPAGSYAMQFTCNHDENSWNGTVYSRLGKAVKTMAALSFVVPGMPLIYSGQEAGLDKSLEFFEKDEINWESLEMQQFYQKLVQLKKDNKALWNGCAGANIEFIDMETDNNLIAFKRQLENNTVLCVFNFSDQITENSFNNEVVTGDYINVFTNEIVSIELEHVFKMKAWDYLILTH
jgi:1,4-alpha-glucan branching enzyme